MGYYDCDPEEPAIPDVCENICPEEEHENCPDYDNCLRFLKWMRRERFYTDDDYKKLYEGMY